MSFPKSWERELETRNGNSDFPRRLISTFTGKVQAFKLKFQFGMVRNQLGRFFKPGRPLPPEIREEIVGLYNAGYSINEVSRTTLVTRRLVLLSSARTLGLLMNHQ